MTCDEIVSILENHGCANLTSALDEATCSQHPIVNGGSGDVFYGRLLNGTQVAIKIIRSSHDPSEKVRVFHKRVAKEIHTWSKCRHRNVAELMGSAVFRDCLAMVSRWENNGNMPHYLSRHPNADRCKMSVSICAGLVYLHSKNIIHGDLKGANVLISRNGTPMLTDFGNASLLDATLLFTATRTGLGFSLRWAPPEILEEANPHTTASDVYSLGMEAHTSEIPFSNRPDQSLLVYIVIRKMLPDRPEKAIPTRSQYGDHLWATLRKCWSYNPKNRPSAETVLERITPITAKTLKEFKDRSDRRKN
ncbi:unnamed protein product [Rhizoctonia solani]|uniref:Protein kinase domain-containing protein n=1 Tax=Rhizoctonia solani TaxID=456999 RepID=A0A8H2WW09_9AGAM|nr:unnamed protein product [Rhizoctonia solani]